MKGRLEEDVLAHGVRGGEVLGGLLFGPRADFRLYELAVHIPHGFRADIETQNG